MISDAYLSEDAEFAVEEMALMRSMVEHAERPLSMTVQQVVQAPDRWRDMLAWVAEGVGRRARWQPGRAPPGRRAAGPDGDGQPDRHLPVVPRDRRPAARRAASPRCATPTAGPHRRRARRRDRRPEGLGNTIVTGFDKLFPMEEPVDYEPAASSSVAARAAARGVSPGRGGHRPARSSDDGHQLLILTLFNYAKGNLDDVREMLLSPNSLIGLGDAGAHCGAISDASFPTTSLALWTKRTAGEGPLPLELIVHHLTQRTGPPGRLARPRRAGRRAPRPTSTSSTSTPSAPTGRGSSTTSRPAAVASCSRRRATCARSRAAR